MKTKAVGIVAMTIALLAYTIVTLMAVVLIAAVLAAVSGLALQDRHEWDDAALYASVIATVGCRLGRYTLDRRALFGLIAPQAMRT